MNQMMKCLEGDLCEERFPWLLKWRKFISYMKTL